MRVKFSYKMMMTMINMLSMVVPLNALLIFGFYFVIDAPGFCVCVEHINLVFHCVKLLSER